MAKEQDNDLEKQDIGSAEGESEESQKKKSKKKGLSSMNLILIIAGILIVNTVVVVGVVKYFFAQPTKEKKEVQAAPQKESEFIKFDDEDSEKFLQEEKQRKLITTGRITTNPSNSIKKFVIVDLGLEYRIKPDMPAENFEMDTPLMNKLMVRVKSEVTKTIGSMDVKELVTKRSGLDSLFKEKLQPIFNKNKMWLRNVYINEYLIQ